MPSLKRSRSPRPVSGSATRGMALQILGLDAEDLHAGVAAVGIGHHLPLTSGATRVTPGTARTRSAIAS